MGLEPMPGELPQLEKVSTKIMALCRVSVFQFLFMVTGFYCLCHQYFTVAWMKCSTVHAVDIAGTNNLNTLIYNLLEFNL